MAGNKRIHGKVAMMKYEELDKHDVDGTRVADFIHGDAEIATMYGTITTRIVKTDCYHFDVNELGPMCVSDFVEIGIQGGYVQMRINAPLRYWTLINRD